MAVAQPFQPLSWGRLPSFLLADAAASFVDTVYAAPGEASAAAALLAMLLFALQIYGDFSGYSDLALGTAGWRDHRLESETSPLRT